MYALALSVLNCEDHGPRGGPLWLRGRCLWLVLWRHHPAHPAAGLRIRQPHQRHPEQRGGAAHSGGLPGLGGHPGQRKC